VNTATSSALQERRKWVKANRRRGSNDIQASIVLLARIGKPWPKGIIRPLEEKVGESVENRILIDRLFLDFDSSDAAETILIVLKYGSGQELIEDLSLTACECHSSCSPY
jgi:hypothetical protein